MEVYFLEVIIMEICIFQINFDRDLDHRICLGSELQKKRFGGFHVVSNIYDLVYKGYIEAESLEELFEIFNLYIPCDYKIGRNMAVSDVIWVVDNDGADIEPGFYFVDGIGFKKIKFKPSEAFDAIKNHVNILKDSGNYHRSTMED